MVSTLRRTFGELPVMIAYDRLLSIGEQPYPSMLFDDRIYRWVIVVIRGYSCIDVGDV